MTELCESCGDPDLHKSDGPGPEVARGRAGLLTVNGDRDRPVFGHAHPVNLRNADNWRNWTPLVSR